MLKVNEITSIENCLCYGNKLVNNVFKTVTKSYLSSINYQFVRDWYRLVPQKKL